MVFLVKRREITHIHIYITVNFYYMDSYLFISYTLNIFANLNEIMYRSNSQTFRFFLRGHFRLDDINPTKDHVLRTHMSDHVSVTLIFVFF